MPDLIILLSTYNGEAFLAQQLDSILQQDYSAWRLYIRDDGSTDKTLGILQHYQEQDQRIQLITDDLGHLGAFASYQHLLESAPQAKWLMFCDQDDIWFQDKISQAMTVMLCDADIQPRLVFCDLTMVDNQLNKLKKYFIGTCNENFNYFKSLIFGNFIPGCSILINNSLRQKNNTMSEKFLSYDHKLLLIAALHGKISYIRKPGLFYRRHDSTVTQANDRTLFYFAKRKNQKFHEMLVLARYLLLNNKEISAAKLNFLKQVVALPNQNIFSRIWFCMSSAAFPPGLVKKIWYSFWVCCGNENCTHSQ
jgi:rhamnosyltransferase